jgi:hypothetical protein
MCILQFTSLTCVIDTQRLPIGLKYHNKLPCFFIKIKYDFLLMERSIFQVFFHHGAAPRHHSNRSCSEVDQGLHSGMKIFYQFNLNLPYYSGKKILTNLT